MKKERWILLHELSDDDKVWAGTIVRLDNVMLTPDDTILCYDYLVSYINGDSEYLQLTCLTAGEAGNILCVLKKDLPNHFALGAELKRMLAGESVAVKFEDNVSRTPGESGEID